MIQPHADREHATWAASSASRNTKCSGALALTMHLPETTSEPADWGTVCHEISDECLRDGTDAERFIGRTMKGKQFSFEVDEEMADTAQTYIDYCRGRIAQYKAETGRDDVQFWIEQRFSLADLKPPFDAGGTGDFVAYFPAWRLLEIADLKGGRGVVVDVVDTVESEEGEKKEKINAQLGTYALGATLAHRNLNVEKVKVTIVQPRAYHPKGQTRSATFHVIDLMEWAADMMAAMYRAREAIDKQATMPESAWAAEYLSPGDHCRDTFCEAAGTCPALRQAVLDAVGVHFDPVDDTPRIANAPDSGSPEERAKRLDMLDMIDGWIKEVRAHEHRLAEMGQPAPGYGLVEKTGREKWINDEAPRVLLRAMGVAEEKWLNPGKLRTPKQVRDALKKAKADVSALVGLSETPKGGTNLVRADSTTRTVKPAVEQHFEAIKE